MSLRNLALAGVAALAFAAPQAARAVGIDDAPNASDLANHNTEINPATGKTYGDQPSALTRVASTVDTETERAVGAGDTFSKSDLNSEIGLKKVGQPAHTLSTAKLDNKNGEILGEVHSVVLDDKGNPAAINVDIGGYLGVGERVIALDANDLKYMPDRNILITTQSKAELQGIPEIHPGK
jgi:hypothetical protein